MKIVVDGNRVIAALIKESTTREIIFDSFFEFVTPDFILTEIRKYEDEIIKKARITKDEFEILLTIIFENIIILSKTDYEHLIPKLEKEINDYKDLPYLAASISSNAYGIWSHDPDLLQQKKVKILTNIDMLRVSGRIEK